MKKFTLLCLLLVFWHYTFSQLTGIKTIPGNYSTIAAAISDLNAQGVGTGGVIFNIAAGHTEIFTSPTDGYISTNTGSSINPIAFQKSGTGINPKITGAVGVGSMDAIICFDGVKYITFDGIDLFENPLNTTSATMIEWGFALLKATATQGSQNITIKNCAISLRQSYSATYGIYSNNHTTAAFNRLTVTSVAGENSNNSFYGNSITNCYNGIFLSGYKDTTPPYQYYDQNNDIGSVSGNSFSNFGGGSSSSRCIAFKFQNDIIIANSLISGGNLTSGSLYGIVGDTAVNANADIYNNSITLVCSPGSSSEVSAIFNKGFGMSGTTNTINIYSNTIHNCLIQSTNYTGFFGCRNGSTSNSSFHTNNYNNIISENSLGTPYEMFLIASGGPAGGSCKVDSNVMINNSASPISSFYCLRVFSAAQNTINYNKISGNDMTGGGSYFSGIEAWNHSTHQDICGNEIHDNSYSMVNGSALVHGISSSHNMYSYCAGNISNNSIYNIITSISGTGTCAIIGITNNYGDTCSNNHIYNFSCITSSGTGEIEGLSINGSPIKVFNNKIHAFNTGGTLSTLKGIHIGAQSEVFAYNNMVYDLKTSISNDPESVIGIYINSFATSANLCNNTIFLNYTNNSVGAVQSRGILCAFNVNVLLKNNIVVNTSTAPQSPNYKAIAYARSSSALTSYSSLSNNNAFYAGVPGPNNLIFSDGTNSDQTLSAYQARVFPRDSASVTELPPFVNATTPPYDVHINPSFATQIESHGLIITVPMISADIDNDPRYPNPGFPEYPAFPATAPDIGADEFAGTNGIPGNLPVVITDPATNVTATSAQLNGTVNAENQLTNVSFEWGTSTSYGTVVTATPATLSGNLLTNVSAGVSGLTAGTTYHFRCIGTNQAGTSYGNDQTFIYCPPVSPAGIIAGQNSVCESESGVTFSVTPIVNATGYQWSLPAGALITSGQGTTSIVVTFGNNSGNITVYGTGICSNGDPSSLFVTVNAPPVPTITGTQTSCLGTISVYNTQAGMNNYSWLISSGGTIIAGGTSSSDFVSVLWNNTGSQSVSVNYSNVQGCTGTTPTNLPVTIYQPISPVINGPATACISNGNIYSTQTGMTGYSWTVSSGGIITNGLGTDSITVNWITTGMQSINVSFTDLNGCSPVVPTTLQVSISNATIPSLSGPIAGCVNSGYFYYATDPGMLNYSWTISIGGTIVNGATTNQIQVTWNTSGIHNVFVNYTNPGGCSPADPTQLTVEITSEPSAASSISGTDVLCAGTSGVNYFTAYIQGALTYVWTLPQGATITSGSGTNSILVDFGTNASSGDITVYGNNLCGNGIASDPFPVLINAIPATPEIFVTGDTLISSASSGNQWYYRSESSTIGYPIPGATTQTYVPTQTGFYWTTITLNNCLSDSSNNLFFVWTSVGEPLNSIALNLFPNPNNGEFSITFTSTRSGTYDLQIFNSIGMVVFEKSIIAGLGCQTEQIKVGNISSGLYMLVLNAQLGTKVKKTFIVK